MRGMQSALSLIYPSQCILCAALVEEPQGLCPDCWRQTPFISGLVCDTCGVTLPGRDGGARELCDDCLARPRPWTQGRAALAYRHLGRKIVLALKHSDRTELALTAAAWMQEAGRELLTPGTLLVPVPIHWTRLLARRYNQSAELARALAGLTRLQPCLDALCRNRRTVMQDGMTAAERIANVAGAIRARPRRKELLNGRNVCLLDDVMTSGATLTEAAQACIAGGARQVSVLVLARVEKNP